MILNKIASILGDVIFKKMKFLDGKEVPIIIFQNYRPNNADRIEAQVCAALTKANLNAIHSEHSLWSEICGIFYAQAFIYKRDGMWASASFDGRSMIAKKPGKISRCNERLRQQNIITYFEKQWKFMEKFVLAYLPKPWHRDAIMQFLLQILKRGLLGKNGRRYVRFERAEIDSKGLYSMYDGIELNIGLKSVRIDTPLPNSEGILRNYYITSNRKYLLKSPFSIRSKDRFFSYHHLMSWQPSRDFKYYHDLFKCIEPDAILKLMDDLIADYSHPPEWYEDANNLQTRSYLGMPDLVVTDIATNSHILLECKAPKDRFHKHQKRWWKQNAEHYNMRTGIIITSKEQMGKLT